MREISLKKMREPGIKILGSDKSPSAIAKARENIKAAGLEDFIKTDRQDFFHSRRPEEGRWTLMFNPPYGERLDRIEVEKFYKQIGDTLKNNYQDTSAWMITASREGLKSMGLRTSRSIPLMNANLESRFVKYEMYAGTRKIRKDENGNTCDSAEKGSPDNAPEA